MISFRISTHFTFSGDGPNVRSVFKFSAVLFGSAWYMLCSENSLRFGLWFILQFSLQKSLLCFGEDIPYAISSGTIPRLVSLHTQYLETISVALSSWDFSHTLKFPEAPFASTPSQKGRAFSDIQLPTPNVLQFCVGGTKVRLSCKRNVKNNVYCEYSLDNRDVLFWFFWLETQRVPQGFRSLHHHHIFTAEAPGSGQRWERRKKRRQGSLS